MLGKYCTQKCRFFHCIKDDDEIDCHAKHFYCLLMADRSIGSEDAFYRKINLRKIPKHCPYELEYLLDNQKGLK